ncbi:MAG: hypothetical protein OXC99_11395 [Chloroflexi bacterium]|nr:hypothetical protein [Chloroflexota bacterium]
MIRNNALMLAALAILGLAMTAACGGSQEAIATRVVTGWVTDNVDVVSDEVVKLVVGDLPVLTQIAGDVLADRIVDSATWEYAEPECEPDDRCRVTATASVRIDVTLPLLGDRRYVASLPFSLLVDTESESVLRWNPVPLDASVEEQER